MRAVDAQIQRVTPEALRITKCYEAFSAARTQLDAAYIKQRKDNLTETMTQKDQERDDYWRCLVKHIEADLYSSDTAKRASAQILANKMDSYGSMLPLGRRAESERMHDMGQDLCTSPWSDEITKLGREADRDAMIKANDEYIELDSQREEGQKTVETNAVRTARQVLDAAYYDVVSAVNGQVAYNNLVDPEEAEEDDGPQMQSVERTVDPLTDFVQSINQLIKSYKTTAAQSGSTTKPKEGEEETPTPEEPSTEEPDDKPVV